MYEEFFGFSGSPFRLNPDPRFFFGSRSHNKAMAYLHYGLRQAEGFIVITGEIGAGKSMLIGHLLDQLDRTNVVAANLLTPNMEPAALLSHVLSAFRIEPANEGKSAELEAFEDFLFDQMNRGRRVLLIVDEAQNLPVRTIEELRMLSNMDYDGTPLFQVFLVGQPEFRGILAKPDMEQFRQRVIATYHLEPLAAKETRDYIEHRLSVVGWSGNPTISDDAHDAIFAATGGVPRKINTLSNRIFLYCALEKLHAIDAAVVGAVVSDLSKEGFSAEDADAETHEEPAPPARARKPQPAPAQKEKAEEAQEAPAEKKRASGGRGRVVVPFGAVKKSESEPAKAETPPVAEKPAEPARPRAPERPFIAAAEALHAMPSSTAQMSVLDRLRARRAAEPLSDAPVSDTPAASDAPPNEAPAPATLSDVAEAIAAAAHADLASAVAGDPDETEVSETADAAASVEAAPAPLPAPDPSNGWRASVIRSLNETREELKEANAAVARLRRQLQDIDRRRIEKRLRIAANLARAETFLAEIRGAWR